EHRNGGVMGKRHRGDQALDDRVPLVPAAGIAGDPGLGIVRGVPMVVMIVRMMVVVIVMMVVGVGMPVIVVVTMAMVVLIVCHFVLRATGFTTTRWGRSIGSALIGFDCVNADCLYCATHKA